jgi:hypothetical protein
MYKLQINILQIIWLIILIISLILYLRTKKEKYTFADYTKFPWCTCVRNPEIV